MTIKSIQEANELLLPYVPLVAQLTGKDTTLKRITPLMKLLGNPQDKLKVVHIAGTSGKTSTAYFLSELLRSSGKKVGLTVSPHIDSVIERVQINGDLVDEQTFCSELATFLEIIERAEQKPSYFELLYAFSMWVFVRKEVDYAVVETGMGGLFDATNVITRPDKICIITDIGIDHTHILGNDLNLIAAQKIGIVHDHNVVFCYNQNHEVIDVFSTWIKKHNAELIMTTMEQELANVDVDANLVPTYQLRNWLLANKVYRYMQRREGLPLLTRQVLTSTLHKQIPAHMEIRKVGNKTIIMDGAHNGQKMSAFLDSFATLYPNIKPAVLVALKHDKDFSEVAQMISSVASEVITTTFETTQDLPVKSMDPNELAEAFNNIVPTRSIPNQNDAYQTLLYVESEVVIITGSFYLLSQLRQTIKELK